MKSVCCRLLFVLILLGPLVGLVPLAYASPPDPAWISGVYDDGDYDDVVEIAASISAPQEPGPLVVIVPVTIVLAVFRLSDAAHPAIATVAASQSRAPPTLLRFSRAA